MAPGATSAAPSQLLLARVSLEKAPIWTTKPETLSD
jgi:hypothetical protein